MRITKFHAASLILVLFVSGGSYAVARNGVDVGKAVVDSRCSAGAFIAHSKAPSAVQADVHSDAAITRSTLTGQAPSSDYAPVALVPTNLMINGTLETLNGSRPKSWDSNATGDNKSTFSVIPGFSSKTGVRIDVATYTGGTADWFGPNIAVNPGGYYQFQDKYRSNVTSRAVLMLKDTTGKSQYINLDSVAASDQWATYTQRFFVPMNVAEIMISHPLDRAGWLETDNYNLQQATARPYSEAMISLTFDDGWRSIHDTALPLMKHYDIVSTQYLVSGFLGRLKEYMSPGQVYDFIKARHEIGSHTFDHPDLTKLSDNELGRQLTLPSIGLGKCYQNISSFAAPFGANNERTLKAEKTIYSTSRSTEVGFNSPDTLNPYQLKVQNVRADTTPQQMRAWVDTAKANHIWLILVYHQVIDNGGEFARTALDFETDLITIKNSNVDTLTIHDANARAQSESIIQKH